MSECKLLACQIAVPVTRTAEDRQKHVTNLVEKISAKLLQQDADLVVLPELSTIEYSRPSFDQLGFLAETLDGQSVELMREMAVKFSVAVVFGMPRKVGDHFVISQIVLDQSGELLGCYDKLHICQYGASMEKEYFQRGNALTIFEVAGFRFAPIICYDIRIPELSRTLALDHDVDCILHCGAYFRDESFFSWHAFATTRALENQLYLLSLNRAGKDYGDSIFCPPWIDESHPATGFSSHDEDFHYLTLDHRVVINVRDQYTFLKDRLAEYSNDEPGPSFID
ncbi:MAG: carbon-nitrogen hydrolase family protein [Gammaproteobacteria bacterium]|nr:carbon-nitrogen hydrolase family protein [Gammaproteobacteria bacterium]